MDVKINYIAVAAAAVAMWVIGAVWYGAFSASWMMYTGVTQDSVKNMSGLHMALTYGGSLVAYCIVFYVQSHIHHAFQVKDLKGAKQAAVWSWLGFVATVIFVTNAFQGKAFTLTMIDSGYWLIGMVVGGMILAKMQKKETSA